MNKDFCNFVCDSSVLHEFTYTFDLEIFYQKHYMFIFSWKHQYHFVFSWLKFLKIDILHVNIFVHNLTFFLSAILTLWNFHFMTISPFGLRSTKKSTFNGQTVVHYGQYDQFFYSVTLTYFSNTIAIQMPRKVV